MPRSHGVASAQRPLSAPELCVVRAAAAGDGREALRLAVVELVVRGVLRLDAEGSSPRSAILQRTAVEADLEAPVAAVAASLGGAPMSLRGLEHELSLTWPTPHDYVWSQVVPALCEKGLMRLADRRRPLAWLGPRLALTPLGWQARRELDDRLAVFDGPFGGWVRDDPARAAAFVAEAGTAVLLDRTAWRAVRELYARRTPADGSGATGDGQRAVEAWLRDVGRDMDFGVLGGGLDGWADSGAGGFGDGGSVGGEGGGGFGGGYA